MIIVRLLSTRAFMVGLAPPSLLGRGSRHCYGINITHDREWLVQIPVGIDPGKPG
jgi:hypothetical protein